MSIPIYQVDAFARRAFAGNPAAVCPLDAWLPDALMQQIAAENNLAETAFFVPLEGQEADFHLRWFTPTFEIDLCGHATLATAHVLWNERGFAKDEIVFQSQSGPLRVRREADGRRTLDFPSRPPRPLAPDEVPAVLTQSLGPGAAVPRAVLASRDLVVEFATAAEVLALQPDFGALVALGYIGLIATAPGTGGVDFVSRFFAPEVGVPEDPVTGSAHSTLIPFWAAKLGKTELFARQESARGGELWCRLRGDRVDIGGYAVTYLVGALHNLPGL
ncbi:PhzF family phenazine biosynthesis protein [Hymenobacter sp. PAMC 26628]|uniref:PhzF family phenazine biosynthesis protein n=1 Tax=Hymenobacter sp. PAMC 26628 TaxID=1484118 RepID=UPI00076FF01A|nr:PhzF family phenazine biosynthesis protein [Hymenobacter sp. PAMC 26628]AMJ66528.1 isomerase [Hymenobacter sp. PAMC 26628]